VYKKSFWALRCPSPKSDDLARLVTWGCEVLTPYRALLEKWIMSGGDIEFFIGGFLRSHLGAVLPSDLVKSCADLGVSLSFDLYVDNEA
jgi:hypothetical protein